MVAAMRNLRAVVLRNSRCLDEATSRRTRGARSVVRPNDFSGCPMISQKNDGRRGMHLFVWACHDLGSEGNLRDAGAPVVCVEEIVGVGGWIHSVWEIQTFPGCQWVQRVCLFCPTEKVGCAHEVTCVGWEVGRGGECGPRRLGLASFRLRKSRPGQKHA